MKIAMWSGPRNLSTAMMYSFAARGDCAVWDEPFYAAYLEKTGLDHPMRDEILDAGEVDSRSVIRRLIEPNAGKIRHNYQKHMTQHMINGIDRSWMGEVTNVFLIRHPARVVASYVAKREAPTFDDIGFWQQAELFDHVQSMGQTPVVVDSVEIRKSPKEALAALCEAIGLPFKDEMLTWPIGGHRDDGVWADHWYGAVHKSTGFSKAEGPMPTIPPKYQPLVDQALPFYEKLAAQKLIIASAE